MLDMGQNMSCSGQFPISWLQPQKQLGTDLAGIYKLPCSKANFVDQKLNLLFILIQHHRKTLYRVWGLVSHIVLCLVLLLWCNSYLLFNGILHNIKWIFIGTALLWKHKVFLIFFFFLACFQERSWWQHKIH